MKRTGGILPPVIGSVKRSPSIAMSPSRRHSVRRYSANPTLTRAKRRGPSAGQVSVRFTKPGTVGEKGAVVDEAPAGSVMAPARVDGEVEVSTRYEIPRSTASDRSG